MANDIWLDRHHINIVYDAIYRLSNGGESPVEEDLVLDVLQREGVYLSRRELAKILLTLEILGRVFVETSGTRRQFRIKILS